MTGTLNIAWITSRKQSCFEWFAQSLWKQLKGDPTGIRVIVVDYWLQANQHREWNADDVRNRAGWMRGIVPGLPLVLTPPKASPWQGPYRLTKKDYFAAANARNTAICLAHDGCLAYVDDLSVLLPTWLSAVLESCAAKRITCGAFKKLKNLVVRDGEVISFDDFPPGLDSRWKSGKDEPIECPPNWLFGCSVVAPVERFLEINGWPEMCDSTGVGMEDCQTGIALANNGHKLWYDRRMLTYESEERHHAESSMSRMDKKGDGSFVKVRPGIDHPAEKGHHLVRVLSKAKRFHNYFEPGGIAALRKRILAGEPFPNTVLPEHDWFDKQPIREL